VTPLVSVIVPVHRPTAEFRRSVEEILGLDGGRHELVVVSDRPVEGLPDAVELVVTGSPADTSPAEKRDAALEAARGEVLAFIDDDAFPAGSWLTRALARLEDPEIAAVGGPGLTPPGSPFRERAGGAFYESYFGSANLRGRFRPVGGVRPVDDWPAFNFVVRREALEAVGGWQSTFYGGEDTKLCLALRDAGFRIVYDPDVVVYHHRRPIFGPHLRQVGNVGRHRGYFVRAFSGTSARPIYFAPAVGMLLLGVSAAVALRRPRGRIGLWTACAGAALAIAAEARRDGHDASVAVTLPAVTLASHVVYGAQFIRGLLTPRLQR
jgi:glycosyltransferase involved in cell wall biosynthesis